MGLLQDILFGLMGLTMLVGVAWLFSGNRGAVDWRTVVVGVILQVVFAFIVLLTPWGAAVFNGLAQFFVTVIGFTEAGSTFIFGDLARQDNFGFIFAFQVLPTIIFFASLMGVLYHLGLMQRLVGAMAAVMRKFLPVSGGESLSVAANVFIGQTEAPLVVRPYIQKMTQSELLTMMVGGMATIAGGVLAAYVGLLGGDDPAQRVYYAKHLLSASIMAAPATIVIAKVLMPETEESLTMGKVQIKVEKTAHNAIEAAANGAADGWRLALNVGAMLLAFLALIAMINWPLEQIGSLTGLEEKLGRPVDLSLILGYLLAPLAWIIGVPATDIVTVGGLIGQKVVANEFVAYVELGNVQDQLSDKARLISTYALCGFANFSSIAIQIGGIGGLAPDRKPDIARFGLRAVLGGTLVTMMTATIAGVLHTL
ncbi:MAG: nucleoside transporter C-terminal domain-containing protein [Xanthomonadales bacterium]|nr:nucleoside transporter C-terminal domain-containing protein [Xanthomonadales bacterium]